MTSQENIDVEAIVDPAEYFLKNSEYHDCHLKVGDPVTDKVERIGVMSASLVAHSTVFRHMLKGSDLADPTGENTHIKDISPEVFKLLLIHMYGGQLPTINRELAVELTICADKYNVQPLVVKACVLLKPTTVTDVFPALRCVAYVSLPDLEHLVTNMVQEITDEIVETEEFLELDLNCVLFIAKQESLAITEVELWQSLIAWASRRGDKNPALRQHLEKLLQHVRFLTLTQEEIVEEVLPFEILTPEESVDLLLAVSGNRALGSPNLCSVREKRGFTKKAASKENQNSSSNIIRVFQNSTITNSELFANKVGCSYVPLNSDESCSNFTLRTSNDVELRSFSCKSRPTLEADKRPIYDFHCTVTVSKFVKGFCTEEQVIKSQGQAVVDEIITFPLKCENGQSLVLEADTTYCVILQFSCPHPVFNTSYKLVNEGVETVVDSTRIGRIYDHLGTITFKTPIHVRKINYGYN